jgi:hypothetical protein
MTLADAQQQRLLERLREAGDEAVAFAKLHAVGIAFPTTVVSEPELNGYVIERAYDHGRLIGVRLLQPEPRTRSRPGGGGRIDSQKPCIPRSRLVRALVARRGEGAPVEHHRSRDAVKRQWSLLPLRVRRLGRLGCTPSGRSAPSLPARSTGAGRAARRVTSTLTNPMTKLRRAVERRLAYAPRFLRHYQHRRQIGCTPTVAFRSARERMRQPHP